jgi:cathepsin E
MQLNVKKSKDPDFLQGTLSPASSTTIPTVTDNAYSKGIINANAIGISFNPTTQPDSVNGVITWGGVDSSQYSGSISYT